MFQRWLPDWSIDLGGIRFWSFTPTVSASPAVESLTACIKVLPFELDMGAASLYLCSSDQMDYKAMGQIFKGLAQTGAWACMGEGAGQARRLPKGMRPDATIRLCAHQPWHPACHPFGADEFNRIPVPVLSVCSTQYKVRPISLGTVCMTCPAASRLHLLRLGLLTAASGGHPLQTVLDALRARKERFVFEDTEIALQPSTMMFITMNPGYPGRAELPESVKVRAAGSWDGRGRAAGWQAPAAGGWLGRRGH